MRLQDHAGLAVQAAELVPLDPVKGGAVEKPQGPPVHVTGRTASVSVGGPISMPYSFLDEEDLQLRAFMLADTTHAYHRLCLRITFDTQDDEPFVEALVRFDLSCLGDAAEQPIGWDAIPERATSTAGSQKVSTSFSAKTVVLGTEIGPSHSRETQREVEEAFAEIHGLLSSAPRWKLRRTTSHRLSGDQPLNLVVRAPRMTVTADLSVSASVTYRRLGVVPYRVKLPPEMTTVLLAPPGP
jgi:hypothetical protein